MKPFLFQQFSIQQSPNVFRVGTDGVLLGALGTCSPAEHILEVGTGTGLIAMMMAQRNPKTKITALDINYDAYQLAEINFRNSPFSDRLCSIHQDFQNFQTPNTWDIIVSNPPYFNENQSNKDTIARQRILLDFPQLISKTADLLSDEGLFSVIIPSTFTSIFTEIALQHHLYLVRQINIFGSVDKLKRHILEFSKQEKTLSISDFIIEKAPREYSDDYLKATQDFHIFSPKGSIEKK